MKCENCESEIKGGKYNVCSSRCRDALILKKIEVDQGLERGISSKTIWSARCTECGDVFDSKAISKKLLMEMLRESKWLATKRGRVKCAKCRDVRP